MLLIILLTIIEGLNQIVFQKDKNKFLNQKILRSIILPGKVFNLKKIVWDF